jgi:hypothetical protein
VRISWNKISSYIQFENAKLNIYGSDNKLLSSLGSSGDVFYYKGTATGFIGASAYEADANRILTLALNSDSTGISFGSSNSSGDTITTKFLYANKTLSGVSSGFANDVSDVTSGLTKDNLYLYGPLHLGGTLHMHSNTIINPHFEFVNASAATDLSKQATIGTGTSVKTGATVYLPLDVNFTTYQRVKVINGIICSV